jgi:hypothetical protein
MASARPKVPRRIAEAIDGRRWADVARAAAHWPEPDVVAPDLADLLVELEPREQALLFRALP